MKWWDRMLWSSFFECWILSQLFHFPLSLSSRGSLVPLCFLPYLVSCAYLVLLIFLPAILMMYSAYKLNKQGDNIQPWCTPLSIWNQSIVPCPVLKVISWPAYRFLRRQVIWSGIPISLRISHSLLWSTQLKTLAKSMNLSTIVSNSVTQWTTVAFQAPLSIEFSWPEYRSW